MRERLSSTHRALVTSVALLTTLTLGAAAQEPADVAGDWALEVDTDLGGRTTPSVVLEQDGTALTGRYSSDTLGEADVTGTVSGNDVTFDFDAAAQGQAMTVTYTLALQEDGTLTGEIDLGGFGGGTVVGRRR